MISKIRDNLFLCAASDLIEDDLKKLGINIVLNVAVEVNVKPFPYIEYIKLGFIDSARHINSAKPATQKLIELLKNKDLNIVVHCRAGRSRSPHVISLALSIVENRDYHDIYREIKDIRPIVMSDSLQKEYEECYSSYKITDKRRF